MNLADVFRLRVRKAVRMRAGHLGARLDSVLYSVLRLLIYNRHQDGTSLLPSAEKYHTLSNMCGY